MLDGRQRKILVIDDSPPTCHYLQRLLGGSMDDLYAVRRYLDAWRGGK